MFGELHECNNKEIYLSGAILVFLSIDAEVAALDLSVGAGSLISRYSLPFKSLCYSVKFSFLTLISVRSKQFFIKTQSLSFVLIDDLPGKELQVHILLTSFRNVGFQAFKLTSILGCLSRIRVTYFLEEHKTTMLMF